MLYVYLFHYFWETTDLIGLKFYMGLRNHKTERTKPDGVHGMHNYTEITIIMRKKWIFSILRLHVAP